MCVVCVEIYKGNMNRFEIERAAIEVQEDHTPDELEELDAFIKLFRPDLTEHLKEEVLE